jgi:hypothetical protein
VIPIRVRRYLFAHYTPETLLNHVFEDLRTPKVPNIGPLEDIRALKKLKEGNPMLS